ncbi:MAG: hypothetical protein AB7S99_04955 [Pseudodonghicola sp.]
MIRRRLPNPTHPIGGALAAVLAIAIIVASIVQDSRERALLAAGLCDKITEALYTPPPSYHTDCYGADASQSCYTYVTEHQPYMRSLWRCADPEQEGRVHKFWRRSSEEVEK